MFQCALTALSISILGFVVFVVSGTSVSTDLYGYDTEEGLDTSDIFETSVPVTSDEASAAEESDPVNNDSPDSTSKIPLMSVCQILVINLPWFGLALTYLILTVEGKYCLFRPKASPTSSWGGMWLF